jgi:hypothetical protein
MAGTRLNNNGGHPPEANDAALRPEGGIVDPGLSPG